ncbi:hypothetical protein M758_11G136900 [Ceratodon purpureus]|nr:hypothetical protein M758_11G136900 [Ceratodon purpureus]
MELLSNRVTRVEHAKQRFSYFFRVVCITFVVEPYFSLSAEVMRKFFFLVWVLLYPLCIAFLNSISVYDSIQCNSILLVKFCMPGQIISNLDGSNWCERMTVRSIRYTLPLFLHTGNAV